MKKTICYIVSKIKCICGHHILVEVADINFEKQSFSLAICIKCNKFELIPEEDKIYREII